MCVLLSRLFSPGTAMPLPGKLSLGIALLLWAPLALSQSTLGELLDAGAKKMSIEEFKDEVVQRTLVGLSASGGNLELMYVSNGTIQGLGAGPLYTMNTLSTIRGEWKTDDDGKICTSMRIGGTPLPDRCQFWFKYAEAYFPSDSDSDRRARVLRRAVKQ